MTMFCSQISEENEPSVDQGDIAFESLLGDQGELGEIPRLRGYSPRSSETQRS